MGKVVTKIKVQNWFEIELLAAGLRKNPPRAAEADALVDTGAVHLYLQAQLIKKLGLRKTGEIRSRTMSNRRERRRVFSPVDLEIQGRSAQFNVIEISDSLPNIVGQVPLEVLDWVVDLQNRILIPNPEHKHGELCDDF